jgi:hypothetical protein
MPRRRDLVDTAPYTVVDRPAPESAADDGKSRSRVANICEVSSGQ